MEFELYEMELNENMKIAVEKYKSNLFKISTGRANPQMLDGIKIDYYDTPTPLSQLAAISVPEARQLLIKPYEQNLVKVVVGVINSSGLGYNAMDEGDKLRINLPEMTTQRRKDLVKSLSKYTEQAKIEIRQSRQNVNKDIKKDDELTEDDEKAYLEEVQNITIKFNNKIDELTKEKEKDLLTI